MFKRAVFHVADHTDDGSHKRFLVTDAPTWFDMFADCVFTLEKLLHELFVHDHNWQRLELIGLFETTALPDWNTHGLEVIRSDNPHRTVRLLSFGHGTILDIERADVVTSAERKRPHGCNRFDSRNSSQAWHELIEKRR